MLETVQKCEKNEEIDKNFLQVLAKDKLSEIMNTVWEGKIEEINQETKRSLSQNLEIHNHWVWSASNIIFLENGGSEDFKKNIESFSISAQTGKRFNNYYFLDNFSPIHRIKTESDPTFSILDVILRT